MIRPIKIVKDLGSGSRPISKELKQKAEEDIELYKEQQELEQQQMQQKSKPKPQGNIIDNYYDDNLTWKPAEWDDYKEDHGTHFLSQKLFNSKTLLDKNKGKKAGKKKHHTEV